MILEEVNSPVNGKITVKWDLAWGKYLQVNDLTQSGGILKEVWNGTLKKLHINPKNILILGLGGGSVANLSLKYFPDVRIIAVDIDPVMVELGVKYLGLDKNKIDIKITDAYEFKSKDKFDLILIDLYLGDKFPEKFTKDEFIRKIKKLSSQSGTIIFNRLYGEDKRADSMRFGRKLEKYFKKVDYIFPQANLMLVCYN
jgi:spermidine synthase